MLSCYVFIECLETIQCLSPGGWSKNFSLYLFLFCFVLFCFVFFWEGGRGRITWFSGGMERGSGITMKSTKGEYKIWLPMEGGISRIWQSLLIPPSPGRKIIASCLIGQEEHGFSREVSEHGQWRSLQRALYYIGNKPKLKNESFFNCELFFGAKNNKIK